MGNICRSPAAETIWSHLARKQFPDQQFHCDSAGTLSAHSGERADPRMRKALSARGFFCSSVARQINRTDIGHFDLILAMDSSNRETILHLLGKDPRLSSKLFLFCEYAGITHRSEVPDPYYGGIQGFDLVIDLLEDGCKRILDKMA